MAGTEEFWQTAEIGHQFPTRKASISLLGHPKYTIAPAVACRPPDPRQQGKPGEKHARAVRGIWNGTHSLSILHMIDFDPTTAVLDLDRPDAGGILHSEEPVLAGPSEEISVWEARIYKAAQQGASEIERFERNHSISIGPHEPRGGRPGGKIEPHPDGTGNVEPRMTQETGAVDAPVIGIDGID